MPLSVIVKKSFITFVPVRPTAILIHSAVPSVVKPLSSILFTLLTSTKSTPIKLLSTGKGVASAASCFPRSTSLTYTKSASISTAFQRSSSRSKVIIDDPNWVYLACRTKHSKIVIRDNSLTSWGEVLLYG